MLRAPPGEHQKSKVSALICLAELLEEKWASAALEVSSLRLLTSKF